MSDENIPEAEVVNASTAVAKRDAGTPPPVKPESVTPAQAKVDAIASLTMTAYARASELRLTTEEQAALQKEFPDEAFRPGAAGKENLIYIEHAHLRDRLNEVLGLGQWSIVPRNRWEEKFIIPASRDREATEGCRIYVEAMLVVRGCFVAEAIGDMVYYPKNQSQNYGDAVEGAKTAALRRCAKELGIGLQAWKKSWCEGWWQRQKAPGRSGGSQGSTPPPATRPAPQSAQRPAAKTSDVVPPVEATEEQKTRFMTALSNIRTDALRFFVSKGQLSDTQQLEALPLKYVPATKKQFEDLMAQIEAFSTQPPPGEEEAWRKFLKPWGNFKGVPLGEVEKNHLYGLVMNYEVEPEYNGQPKSAEQLAADTLFRKMLDDAGRHYGWIKEQDPF